MMTFKELMKIGSLSVTPDRVLKERIKAKIYADRCKEKKLKERKA